METDLKADIFEKFFIYNKNKIRDGYIWTLISGILNAGQSVIWLMVITRMCALKYAGIFAIAYAIANLMLNIGKYGVKNFQVTDIKPQYSFSDYFAARIVTCGVMLLASIFYIMFGFLNNNYSVEKIIIIMIFCFMKLVDAIEDVYYGDYQQKGRIDVGSKAVSIRYLITTVLFCVFLIIFKQLLISSLLSLLCTLVISIVLIYKTRKHFDAFYIKYNPMNVKYIIRYCFPLFAGYYLSYYLGNIPKYAIDKYMNEEVQACFNFIFMPVFFVNLFSTIIFQPILSEIATCWEKKQYTAFKKIIWKQIFIIFLITFAVAVLGYMFGTNVLSLIYNTDLQAYRYELTVLLAGGGLLALSAFLSTGLTVIRCQKHILIGYCLAVVVSKISERILIMRSGIMGMSVLYTVTMSLLCIIFSVFLSVNIRKT